MNKLQRSGGEIWFVIFCLIQYCYARHTRRKQIKFLILCFVIIAPFLYQSLRARVAAKAEEKKLELLFLRWSEHQRKLGNFIRYTSNYINLPRGHF